MSEKQQFQTMLAKVNSLYFPMIERQITGSGIDLDEYSRSCVMNAISSINNTLDKAGVSWTNEQLDQSNITQILLNVALLKLNAAANPNEVYFQIRNVKTGKKDDKGKDIWKKQIEMGIEGDGNDSILSNFGRNVREVRQHWLVREGDEFEYPMYNGLEMDPPKWRPTGKGKVVRVVYPIIKTSKAVEYHIAEREDVIKNLIAHVKNNLMNETFGIAENRFKATAKQKEQINEKKEEIIQKIKELGLDSALDDKELQKYISPAWKDEQSRESMIVRKMRNNIVKKIPKDFGHTLVELGYDQATEENTPQQETFKYANTEIIDIETEPQQTPEKEPQQESEQPQEENPTVEEVIEQMEKTEKEPVTDAPPF